MELNLHFGGFYDSVHSDIIDSIIGVEYEYEFDEETTSEEDFYDNIDYKKTCLEYCKYYVDYFFDYILDVHGIKLTIKSKNIDMWSPREYNFSTDIIVLKEVSKSTVKNLTTLFNRYLEDSEFRGLIKDKTTSRSGYIPFYNYEEVVDKEKLNISLELILQFLANEFNNEADDLYYKMTQDLSLSYKN